MKLSDIDDADKLVTKDYLEVVLGRFENRMMDKLTEQIGKLNDRFDGWLRWVIGLQLGSYILIIGGYFLHK